jgi:hypothetical protein
MLLRSKLLLSLSVLSFAAALVAPRPAAALYILDSFDDTNSPAILTCLMTTVCTPAGDPVSSVGDFSAARSSQIKDTSTLIIDGSGKLTYSANSVDSELLLDYALSNVDITDSGMNTGFVLSVLSVSGVDSAKVTMTDGSGNVSATVSMSSLAVGDNFVFFTDFLAGLFIASSLTDINQISVLFPTGQTGSIELAEIQVPEPSTAGMLLLGLAGLACSGRRRPLAV